MAEMSVGEEEKWTNNETDKQTVTLYKLPYPSFLPNFIILIQVVAETSLIEKVNKQTIRRQTLLLKKQKLNTPIYFVYWG